ncbi:thiazole synthase [uncultured Veillonella sp.]|uniref:thiazole synthase n=1 Tax=uncultured Veillonella sp. TaxID=159268 RepID=UPI0025917684|nr:thiazole synthase [uncultured Veillonella sp.]
MKEDRIITAEQSEQNDEWYLGDHRFSSRFILGSGKFSLPLIQAVTEAAEVELITLALRRTNEGGAANILEYIPSTVSIVPNTSGARNAEEAVRIARLAHQICNTPFIKIEIMRDSRYLLPDNQETVKATEQLVKEGFVVMPYMFPDLTVARDLVQAGAACVMPLAAPIGSNKGLINKEWIQLLVDELSVPIIVDAGIGKPSEACEAMEMGVTAIMANTAIATAKDISGMAKAFNMAIQVGRRSYVSGMGRVLERGGQASSPLTGYLR